MMRVSTGRNVLREHRQKNVVTLSRFWPLRRWGWGEGWGVGESVKEGKFARKTFFQIMLNESLKSYKTDIW